MIAKSLSYSRDVVVIPCIIIIVIISTVIFVITISLDSDAMGGPFAI